MEGAAWAKVHGASVHFPIALVLFSVALDAAGLLCRRPASRLGLHAAGYWAMLAGAAGTVPAVISGLVMTKGVMLGHGALRTHHLFAWPALALVVGAATWRVLSSDASTREVPRGYMATVALTAGLLMAAGYWGGELLLSR